MPPPDGGSATVGTVLADAIQRLRASGSSTPRLDAEVLLAHVAGHDRSWVLAHPEAALDDRAAFEAALVRRTAGEPIAYIRGFKEWRSLRILTDRRALIPRPETELLAQAGIDEVAARLARFDEPVVAWEVATGSGAVAVAIAIEHAASLTNGRLSLIASDLSSGALALATENVAAHGVDGLVTLIRADLLEVGALPRPNVVIANLPYVASAEVAAREGSLGYEPRDALDGGRDGLDLIRRLLAALPGRTAPGATVLLEIGAGQSDVVSALAPAGASVSIRADLAAVDRVVRIEMPD